MATSLRWGWGVGGEMLKGGGPTGAANHQQGLVPAVGGLGWAGRGCAGLGGRHGNRKPCTRPPGRPLVPRGTRGPPPPPVGCPPPGKSVHHAAHSEADGACTQ